MQAQITFDVSKAEHRHFLQMIFDLASTPEKPEKPEPEKSEPEKPAVKKKQSPKKKKAADTESSEATPTAEDARRAMLGFARVAEDREDVYKLIEKHAGGKRNLNHVPPEKLAELIQDFELSAAEASQ